MLIDLHLELDSLIEFYNDHRSFRNIALEPYKILEAAKAVLKNTVQEPFLRKSESQTAYYQKYVNLWHSNDNEMVPEFYFEDGDIYDLDVRIPIMRKDLHEQEFSIFFVVKIDEIRKLYPDFLEKYFDFQLYDNFYGDIDYYINYLEELPAIAPNFRQLPEIVESWATKKSNKETKTRDIKDDWPEFLASKKNYKIPGNLTEEQIKHFFTFLCEEKKGENAYLKKEELDIIFENGFTIPTKPLEKKFKLNYNARRSKKVVDYAIHKFYQKNSKTQQDKSDYILFFAHFLEDYAAALNSRHELVQIQSNLTGREPKRWTVKWDFYLPQ